MRGKICTQVGRMMVKTKVLPKKGEGRHKIKQELAEKNITTKHDQGKNCGFSSWDHANKCVNIYEDLARYAQNEHGLKDFEKLDNNMVRGYLIEVSERPIQREHFNNVRAAISKLEYIQNLFAGKTKSGNTYNFEKVYQESKAWASELEKGVAPRAMADPQKVIDNIKNPDHRLRAQAQYEAGARINAISLITTDRLAGIKKHPYLPDKIVGEIRLHRHDNKGGKAGSLYVSKETYERIERKVNENGGIWYQKDKQEYRDSIKEATLITGDRYTGSHALRHNYAQRMVGELQKHYSAAESLRLTSKLMFHERPQITQHYLRA
jgi:integrase